jgi:tRNA-binding protein
MSEITPEIKFEDFLAVDIRVGIIISADVFPEARKPAYKLLIDFGANIGQKKSSAQITVHYTQKDLVGRKILAVVNFPRRQIGPFMSEVLTLGFADENGDILLASCDGDAPIGSRLI